LMAHANAGELSATEASQGRLFISVSDFQKILRGKERILSSDKGSATKANNEQDARDYSHGSVAALKALGSKDKALMYKKVLPIAQDEQKALSLTVDSLSKKLAQIKAERKSLQHARMSQSKNKAEVQKQLFKNLVSESNTQAKLDQAQKQIQSSNVLVLEFVQRNDQTKIVKVQHGTKVLWKNPGQMIARN